MTKPQHLPIIRMMTRAVALSLLVSVALNPVQAVDAEVSLTVDRSLSGASSTYIARLAERRIHGWADSRQQQLLAAAAEANLELSQALSSINPASPDAQFAAAEMVLASMPATAVSRVEAGTRRQRNNLDSARRLLTLEPGGDPLDILTVLPTRSHLSAEDEGIRSKRWSPSDGGAHQTLRAGEQHSESGLSRLLEGVSHPHISTVLGAVASLPSAHRTSLHRLAGHFVDMREAANDFYRGAPAMADEPDLPRLNSPVMSLDQKDGARTLETGPSAAKDHNLAAFEGWPAPGKLEALNAAVDSFATAVANFRDVWSDQTVRLASIDCMVMAPALALDLAGSDCEYPSNQGVALSIDIAGYDRYLSPVGGNGFDGACTPGGVGLPPVSDRARAGAAVDLIGDDEYLGWGCGINGGGNEGLGFLFDGGGDDIYRGGGIGSNGGGAIFGHGLLLDGSGNDQYLADSRGANGGAWGGATGRLIDVAGDDSYEVQGSENAGVNGGAGNGVPRLYALVEASGLLVDLFGNDSYYSASGFGANGGGYWMGNGFLVDAQGVDSYTAGDHGVNGGAIWEATGFLLDGGIEQSDFLSEATNEYGWSMSHGGNGGGQLDGFGMMLTGPGPNVVQGGSDASNGGGAEGVGVLIDAGGPDQYLSGEGTGVNGGASDSYQEAVHLIGYAFGALVDLGVEDDEYRAGRTIRTFDGGTKASPEGGAVNGGANTVSVYGEDGNRYPRGLPPRGFLYDGGGNDNYKGVGAGTGALWPPAGGVNGGGAFYSVGTLIDAGGDDSYDGGVGRLSHGGGVATNGGAWGPGIGMLLDAGEGQDDYIAHGHGTNGGSTGPGLSLLVDGGGDDSYTATTVGTNGGGEFNGVGTLIDLSGDDLYEAGSSGSNGGGRGGHGLLYDASGDDRYVARLVGWHPDGGSNGGARTAEAVLNGRYIDLSGSGLLVDAAGDDYYEALGAVGVNGGGRHSTDPSTRSGVAIGALWDCGGSDQYADDQGGSGQDVTVLPKEDLGAQMDVQAGVLPRSAGKASSWDELARILEFAPCTGGAMSGAQPLPTSPGTRRTRAQTTPAD
jgi:hypothetical protein